ncbi:MAG: hypothetical protein WAV40_00980 [Microgenomates group bacterium]
MKILVIGASTTGKTTLIKHLLSKAPELPIQEADDVLTSLNGGTYPVDSQRKHEVLAPKMVKQILNQKSIIFFTNAHYFKLKDLIEARRRSFMIILLKLPRGIMLTRNINRVKHEGYDNLAQYFDDMLRYQDKVLEVKLVDAIIDTNRPIDDVISDLGKIIGINS